MRFTRRRFIGAGLAGALVPMMLRAELTLPGGDSLTTLSDGHLVLPRSFVIGDLPEEEASAIVTAAGLDPDNFHSPCNLTLWRRGEDVVLFDAGSGTGFMPSAGAIVDSLAAEGLSPDDITHVVFTHGHPDHLWGALDDFDEPLFLNAAHIMGAEEAAYWTDPATPDTIGAARQSFAAGAARRLEILGDGLRLIGEGEDVLPGLTARSTPGHTPGHLAFDIASGEEVVTVVGDAVANSHLALARPDWLSPSDQDPEAARETRLALLADLAESGRTMVGFHLPDGGMGRIAAADEGYAFTAL